MGTPGTRPPHRPLRAMEPEPAVQKQPQPRRRSRRASELCAGGAAGPSPDTPGPEADGRWARGMAASGGPGGGGDTAGRSPGPLPRRRRRRGAARGRYRPAWGRLRNANEEPGTVRGRGEAVTPSAVTSDRRPACRRRPWPRRRCPEAWTAGGARGRRLRGGAARRGPRGDAKPADAAGAGARVPRAMSLLPRDSVDPSIGVLERVPLPRDGRLLGAGRSRPVGRAPPP